MELATYLVSYSNPNVKPFNTSTGNGQNKFRQKCVAQ
jgi:hypothetical protein